MSPIASAVRRTEGIVVVGVLLEGEGSGRVAGEGLKVPDGLPTLGKQRQAAMAEIVEADGGEAYLLQ